MNDAMPNDASADASSGWAEKHVQEGMRAAEFFEQHAQKVEAERTENQLIALLVGLVIGVVIALVIKLRKSKIG